MKKAVILMTLCLLALLTLACGDDGISFPTGDGGWQVGITLGEIPPRILEVPVLIEVRGDVINLTDGDRPVDGSVVAFTSSGGSFGNGLTEVELATVNGSAVAVLEIQLPGTYEVEVAYPQESCSAVTVFSVGLE